MELITVEQNKQIAEPDTISGSKFIHANTTPISYDQLKKDCIIPVFAKDNESTISHTEFINVVYDATKEIFVGEHILEPSVVVSHPIKGRIPAAIGKPANDLKPHEKTIYYERMAFLIEIKSIFTEVDGNNLSLTVGGVRAYNLENLYSKKSPERFKVFIGFKNSICTNLCVSTDGFKTDIRVFNLHELFENSASLINGFNHEKQLNFISELNQFSLSEEKFSKLIGRSKMFQYMPVSLRGQLVEMPLGDSQLNSVIKGYYGDDNFSCRSDGSIDLWRLYNLFTGATRAHILITILINVL